MEEKFIAAWQENREKALALGVRIRPIEPKNALKNAKYQLSGSRRSEGFDALAADRRFTALFTDEEANNALERLLDAGYFAK